MIAVVVLEGHPLLSVVLTVAGWVLVGGTIRWAWRRWTEDD